MATRKLRTRPEWEDALRSGRKTIDARLVADDIAELKVGDRVRYPGATARVQRIRFYPGFADLLAYEDWHRIAPDAASRDEVLSVLEAGHEATVRAHRGSRDRAATGGSSGMSDRPCPAPGYKRRRDPKTDWCDGIMTRSQSEEIPSVS